LPHRLVRENVIHQQSCAVSHPPRPATGAETAAFAAERHQFLMVTGFTTYPEKAMFKPATLQILIKFPADESGQVFAVAGQFGCKPVAQTNTGSIRLRLWRSQWPYSRISVSKICLMRFA